ncbi:MAG: hypothetical protein WBN83_02015 [Desulfoprunum sp.]|uniref:hypothetical protein n=1 Tax=Desulfoprunum sp. TaxID=2020866 RepID=UPI003C71671B
MFIVVTTSTGVNIPMQPRRLIGNPDVIDIGIIPEIIESAANRIAGKRDCEEGTTPWTLYEHSGCRRRFRAHTSLFRQVTEGYQENVRVFIVESRRQIFIYLFIILNNQRDCMGWSLL